MAKGQFLDDTFEKLAEMGQSTAKKTVKSVAQTFNPANMIAPPESASAGQRFNTEQLKNQHHTPLNIEFLEKKYTEQDAKKYQNEDAQKMEALRNKLFQMVKSDEEKILQEKHQKEAQLIRQEEMDKKQKEKQIEEKKLKEQQQTGAKGKEKKGLFTPKKKAREQYTEMKPATGKS